LGEGFGDRAELANDFTADTEAIRNLLDSTARPFGKAAFVDAILLAARELKGGRNLRKALLVIASGGGEQYKQGNITTLAGETGVPVYAIGFSDALAGLAGRTPEEIMQSFQDADRSVSFAAAQNQLAIETGGWHVAASDLADLPEVADRIGIRIRNVYEVGYIPTNSTPDGRFRKLELKLVQPAGLPPLRVLMRPGYRARAE